MDLADKEKEKKIVVFPSTTWTTSVAPFVREGFTPKFIDINLSDFSFDYLALEKFVKENSNSIAAIFPTSLLGFVPNISLFKELSEKYSVRVMFDNCENTFGQFEGKNISSFFTSTTSTYFGHHLQSVEGGFVFTNDKNEYERFLMFRNHGMTRSVIDNQKYLNPDVDSRFDFYSLGNNFRNSEIHALIGLIDLGKAQEHIRKRVYLYESYYESLSADYILPSEFENRQHVAFALPIIIKDKTKKENAIKYCHSNGIETRPIISGNLLRQTCYKKFDDYKNYPNSEFLHQNGFYVGLHAKLKEEDIEKLVSNLNNL
jgi:CDP-6-deoxy-D-xylo-4-hexulose-3-dehydrase